MDSTQAPQKVLIRTFRPQEIVLSESTAQARFYVLLQGSVEILNNNTRIRVLHEGDVFGMEHYYLKEPCLITAQTLTAARVAAYHIDMINDIICENPKLTHRLLASVVRQLYETTLAAARNLTEMPCTHLDGWSIDDALPAHAAENSAFPDIEYAHLDTFRLLETPPPETDHNAGLPAGAADPAASSHAGPAAPGMHDDMLVFFLEESAALLRELELAGEKLKLVGIPNDQESEKLIDFAQKLNRLIGGTAAMGFHQFSQLSRKTSLIAARCAEIREMTIRILISNLNLVVSVLADCFQNIESIKKAEQMIPQLNQRLDICMAALGIEHPDIQSQSEIDAIFERCRTGSPA